MTDKLPFEHFKDPPLRQLDFALAKTILGWKYDLTAWPQPWTVKSVHGTRYLGDGEVPRFSTKWSGMGILMMAMQSRGRLIEAGNDICNFRGDRLYNEDGFGKIFPEAENNMSHEVLWEAGFTDGHRYEEGGSPLVAARTLPLAVAIAVALAYDIDVDGITEGKVLYVSK